MSNTIATSRPPILYEVDDAEAATLVHRWDALDRFVEGLGYDVSRLEDAYPNLAWHVGHSLALPQPAPR
jgi:hypothetical protein